MRSVFIVLMFFCFAVVHSQKASSLFLRYGLHDGELLTKEYLRPFGNMLGINLNNGWYNNAGIHKVGGFDITLVSSYTVAPTGDGFYDLEKLASELADFTLDPAAPTNMAPTVAGKTQPDHLMPNLLMKSSIGSGINAPILPNGAEFNRMILPSLQVAVGIPLNTEVMVRFTPKLEFDKYGKASIWGVGLKHSLWDDFLVLSSIPFLRLSVMGGYTNLNTEIALERFESNTAVNHLNINSDAITGRLLVGTEFPVVALYGGVGYGRVKSSFDLKGDFTVYDFSGGSTVSTIITNPLSLNYNHEGLDYNVGLRLKLMFLTLHADYTFSDYQSLTVGVGLSFR